MSGENCVWKPSVINKKGEEVNSKLFNSLLHFSQNNREFAKKWYYIGTSEEFLEANRGKVQLDENGEITFNSLRKLANIDIKEELILEHLNAHLGNEAKDYNTAISLANSFNSSSEFKDDFVAIIGEVVDGKTRIQVVKKTEAALAQHETNVRNKVLFDRIKAAVERVGGSISFIEETYSRYSTENAKKLASGLYNVIQLARKKLSSNSHEGSSGNLKGYTQEMKDILAKAPRDSQDRLLAPNGKPSNLTEKQYIQVRTKAFKEWFGDWENNPENASKVIDENGEPLVVIHNTKTPNITIFKPGIADSIYFADKGGQNFVSGFERGDYNYEVFLNIRKPTFDTEWTGDEDSDGLLVRLSKQQIIDNTDSEEEKTKALEVLKDGEYAGFFAVSNPNQIKSATDNSGAFSSANDDIYDTDTKISIEDAAEEAGHFAVGALGEDPLVKRLEALCSSKEVQQQILGEDYLDIQSRDNPVRETIGQLVGKHILREVDNID